MYFLPEVVLFPQAIKTKSEDCVVVIWNGQSLDNFWLLEGAPEGNGIETLDAN